eukprot:g8335.t1
MLQQGSSSGGGGILGTRSLNLSSSSIALTSSSAALMREFTVRPVAQLLSQKALEELAGRNRLVDYLRVCLKNRTRDATGHARVQAIAVAGIEAIHTGMVVDKPAQELQNVLLAELDDISPDYVPTIVNAVLAPLLAASKRQARAVALHRLPPTKDMSEAAAAGFLVVLDILPKLIGVTAGVPALSEDAPVPEDVRGLSGAQYKDKVVSRLFRARWPGAVSVGMCQVLRDLDLGERHLSVAVSRVLRHLRKSAKLHDLPPLTYQLLLLAGRGCKEAALEGVIQVFDRLDAEAEAADREDDSAGAGGSIPIRRGDQGGGLGANSTEELRFVEGTILLHFNFAMKQDHNLASCVLKGFQRRAAAAEVGRACTPFRLALLLSLSRIQRFSQPVLDLVQDIVSDCLVYDHAREGSAWLESEEEIARGGRYGSGGGAEDPGSDGEGGGGIGSGSSSAARVVQRVLLRVIASSRGWDHLMESFLKIGLQLLDRGGAGAAGVASCPGAGARGMLEKLQGAQPHRASLRASHLGRVVLMETFKTHEETRPRILAAVLEQVTARSQGVLGYVKLLGLLVERNPNLVLEKAAAVQDVFGYISVLPPPVAERFLVAVAPLLRLRPRLQDSVVLPLRKALFSREERARLVAVRGLVQLLKVQGRNAAAAAAGRGGDGGVSSHGGTQMSQTSQMSEGQMVMMPPLLLGAGGGGGGGGGRALSLAEGFGLLRRCLTQQMVVRTKLYDGLLSSFARGSLDIQLDTVSLLMGHLRRYVSLPLPLEGEPAGSASRSGGGGGMPLLLSRCIGSTGDIVEPLPLLLGCLHRMLVSGRESLAEHARSSSSIVGDSLDTDNMLEDGTGDGGAGAVQAGMVDATADALRATLEDLGSDLQRLSAILSRCPLEEFDLDKVADFSPTGGPAARGNLATAALLCGSYEALMQGSLLLSTASGGGGDKLPAPTSIQSLLGLFDCRQTLLSLVRPSLPTSGQQRSKKGAAEASSGSGSGSGSDGIGTGSFAGEGASRGGGAAALPGFSAAGCFGLTLHPGGMPCLGMTFVEDMLNVLNVDKADDEEETEGDTERDPGLVDVDMAGGDPPTEAVREDLGLQRLVLETCRGHLRALRTGAAAASPGGLTVDIGGGPSAKGVAVAAHSGGPQDEADAVRAGKTAVKKCTALAPLLLKEVFRQLAEGNTSAAAKEAMDSAKGSKGKGKGAGGDKGAKKKAPAPSESLSELALSCFEECVCITAHCSLATGTAASRTAKLLAVAYDSLPCSNIAPADSAFAARGGGGGAAAAAVIGRHAKGLVQTFTTLVGGAQMKEAETVCRILAQLTRLLRLHPASLDAHGASLKTVCQQQSIKCPILAKAAISLYLQAHLSMKPKGGKIAALHDLATQVSACVGLLEMEDSDEEDEPPVLTFQLVNDKTITPVIEVTIGAVQACVDDVEYALRLMQKAAVARQARVSVQTPEGLRSFLRAAGDDSQSSGTVSEDDLSSDDSCADLDRNSDSDEDAAGIRSDGGVGERDPLDRRETLVCDRLRIVMNTLTVLLHSDVKGRFREKLVSTATRVFRAITKVLKVRLSLKKAYAGAGLKHVLAAKQGFTRALQAILPKLEAEEEKVTKNVITRQSRLVPSLVFQMEECDVQLLLLGKLCKGSLDLPKWVTSRVDRDFRIDQGKIDYFQDKARTEREKRKRGAGGKDKGKGKGSSKKKKGSSSSSLSRRKSRSTKESKEEEEEEQEEDDGDDEDEDEEDDDEDEESGSDEETAGQAEGEGAGMAAGRGAQGFQEEAVNELIRTFESRDDDVFVCTFFKSGTTWVQQIITMLLNKGEQGDKNYAQVVPYMESLLFRHIDPADGGVHPHDQEAQGWTLEKIKSSPDRRFMKSHANLKLLPVGKAKGLKVIYVARNPKDVSVSLYHHARNKRWHGFVGDERYMISCFVKGRCVNGSWFNHVLEWWEAATADPEHVLFLHYEGMLAEPEAHIRKIAEFAGIEHTDETIAKTVAATSIDAMKRNPKANLYRASEQHIRKGGAGGWRDVYTVRESEAFDEIYLKEMEGTGLKMDFGEGLVMPPHTAGRTYTEYAPAAPSPSDLKGPLPDKYSVGKNLKLKAVLIQYEILAGSDGKQARAKSSSGTRISTGANPSSSSSSSRNGGFQLLTPSGEKLVDEITGLLGGDSLQGMGRKLMADLKNKMGTANSSPKPASSPGVQQKHQQPRNAQGSDPKAKYMEKLRKKTGGGITAGGLGATAASLPGGDADLFVARNLVSSKESANLKSAWMLRQGAGDLLTYIAARSVRLGVIAGPRTTPREFENFVKQLRQQSIRVTAAVPPEVVELEGMEAGLERASRELRVGEGGGAGGGVLVVGSSEPLLSAATAAEMFTARFHPVNSRREGVIQTFTVRSIDEVRTVVEQINGRYGFRLVGPTMYGAGEGVSRPSRPACKLSGGACFGGGLLERAGRRFGSSGVAGGGGLGGAQRGDSRDTSSRELLADLFPAGFTSNTLSPSHIAAAAATDGDEIKRASARTLVDAEPELKGQQVWACLLPEVVPATMAAPNGASDVDREKELQHTTAEHGTHLGQSPLPPSCRSYHPRIYSELHRPNGDELDNTPLNSATRERDVSADLTGLESSNAKATTATRRVDFRAPPGAAAAVDPLTAREQTSSISDSGGHEVVVKTETAEVAWRERERDLMHALDRLVARLAQSQERVKLLEGHLEQAKHVESGRNTLVKQITRLQEEVKHANHRLEIHHAETVEWRENRQDLEANNERLGAELHCALGRNARLETENRRKDALLVEVRKSAHARAENNSTFEPGLRRKDQLVAEAERTKKQAWQATSASAGTAKAATTWTGAAVKEASDPGLLRGDSGGPPIERSDENCGFSLEAERSDQKCSQSLTDVLMAAAVDGGGYGEPEKTRRSTGPARVSSLQTFPVAEQYGDRRGTIYHRPETESSADRAAVPPPNEAVPRGQKLFGRSSAFNSGDGFSSKSNGTPRVPPPQAAVVTTNCGTPRTTPHTDFFDNVGSDRNACHEEDEGVLSPPPRETQEPTTNKTFLTPVSGGRMRVVETPPPVVRATVRAQGYDGDRQRHDSEGVKGALTGSNPAWTDTPSSCGDASSTALVGSRSSGGGGGAAGSEEFARRVHTSGREAGGGDGRIEEARDQAHKFSTWVSGRIIDEVGLEAEGYGTSAADETPPVSRGWKLFQGSPPCPAAGHRRGRDMMSSRRSSLSGAGVGVSAEVTDERAPAPFATDAAEDELRPIREVERRLMLLQMEMSQLEAEQGKLMPKASKTMQARTKLKKIDSRLALLASESSGLRRIIREKPWRA